jgi:hypothetical protein
VKKISIALLATLALVGISTNSSPVLATTTPAPSLLSPSSGAMLSDPATVSFQLGAAHLPGSVRVTLTHASLANTNRTFSFADASITVNRNFSGSIDLLDAQSVLSTSPVFGGISTLVANAVNTSDRMPAGRYTVAVSYQDATANPPASSSATNVGLDACGTGYFSSAGNGFVPSSGGCTPASTGTFVDTIGATSQIPCVAGTYQSNMGSSSCDFAPAGSVAPASGSSVPSLCVVGTYQPDSGQITCLQSAAGHFVDQAGATAQQECGPGTYQPNLASSSCVRASIGSFVSGSRAISQTICAAGTTTTNLGSTVCISIPVTTTAPSSNAPVPTIAAPSSLQKNKKLAIGKKAKLSSMIKPTKGAKLKWSVSGGCKVQGIYVVAPKRVATCSITLRQTLTKKAGGKRTTTTSTSRISVTVS